MLKTLIDSEYKSNVINKFSIIFNNNYALTDKILNHYIDKGYNDKQIFKLFHTYYWKNIKQEPNKQKEAEFRAINKSKELKELFTGIKYNKDIYLDIGCEECILPISFGKVLGIENVNCVNIKDWESNYNINKSNMSKCKFKYYDGINLPYDKNTISIISTTMVLHHIKPEDRNKLLQNVYNVLSPRGLLVIREHDSIGKMFDDYVDFIHRFYDSILLKKFHWLDKYTTFYQSKENWKKEITSYGFKIIRNKTYDKKVDRPFMEIYVKK